MSTSHAFRSRISRETRQLLVAALIALVALWVLARIRFPGQSPSPNPIPSLLSQLASAPRFANLAGEIAELQGRLSTSWLTVAASGTEDGVDAGARQLTAMRLRRNAAVVLVRGGDRLSSPDEIVATDRVTGLAIVRTAEDAAPVGVPPWMPQSLKSPQYFMATVGTPAGVSLRPVLVASMHESHSPAWSGAIWSVPEGTDLAPSSFVFTTSGEIAGLVVREPTGLAIVPWEVEREEATRIIDGERNPAVDLRMEVRALTPALAKATGATQGVVVAWVDSRGPAAKHLLVGDVIMSVNARSITDTRDWEVASSRLPVGAVTMHVRRRGKPLDVQFTAPAVTTSPGAAALGLTMRRVPGVGVTIVRIDPRSAASAARLQEGDIITLVGHITAPTAAQIGDAFRSARPGEAIMLAITRGQTHLVVGLVK
jgi:S1-C subfamily serine protease